MCGGYARSRIWSENYTFSSAHLAPCLMIQQNVIFSPFSPFPLCFYSSRDEYSLPFNFLHSSSLSASYFLFLPFPLHFLLFSCPFFKLFLKWPQTLRSISLKGAWKHKFNVQIPFCGSYPPFEWPKEKSPLSSPYLTVTLLKHMLLLLVPNSAQHMECILLQGVLNLKT